MDQFLYGLAENPDLFILTLTESPVKIILTGDSVFICFWEIKKNICSFLVFPNSKKSSVLTLVN